MPPSLQSLAYHVYTRREYGLSAVRRRRIYRHLQAVYRYREVAREYTEVTTRTGWTWRRLSRLWNADEMRLFDEYRLERLRYLMDAAKIRLQMQRFVRGLRRMVRRARWLERLYGQIGYYLNGMPWRTYTRAAFTLRTRRVGLRNFPVPPLRVAITLVRIRLWMQRFAQQLRRLVTSARETGPISRRLRRRLR